jgi:hypothetical protein
VFVNPLCEAKGEQDAKADEAQESLGEFVITSGNSPVALDSLEEVFHSMTTPVELAENAIARTALLSSWKQLCVAR